MGRPSSTDPGRSREESGAPAGPPAAGDRLRRGAPGPWSFLALTFGWSWLFWGLAVATARPWTEPPTVVFYVLGGFGPSLVAILFVHLSREAERSTDFWRRVVDFRRIAPAWYATILAVAFLPSAAARLVPSGLPDASAEVRSGLTAALLLVAVGAAFAEELGWRGYALDRWLATRSALAASLWVGLAWTLWHLPFYFIEGTIQHEAGLWSRDFQADMITRVPLAVLFGWIYVNTGRSILSAILLHALDNVASVVVGPEGGQVFVRLAIVTAWAMAVVFVLGPDMRRGRAGA